MGGNAQNTFFHIFGPSRILELKNVTTFDLTAKFEVCREVYTDIHTKCSEFGRVLSIEIPRPMWVEGRQKDNLEAWKDDPKRKKNRKYNPIEDKKNFDMPEGFGSVFVEFESVEDAMRAKRHVGMQTY